MDNIQLSCRTKSVAIGESAGQIMETILSSQIVLSYEPRQAAKRYINGSLTQHQKKGGGRFFLYPESKTEYVFVMNAMGAGKEGIWRIWLLFSFYHSLFPVNSGKLQM